jgi:hypothetical protein
MFNVKPFRTITMNSSAQWMYANKIENKS